MEKETTLVPPPDERDWPDREYQAAYEAFVWGFRDREMSFFPKKKPDSN